MNIKSINVGTGPILLSALLFLTIGLSAQTNKKTLFTSDTLAHGSVWIVSTRIASLYGADLKTVESYVQAAVSLESKTHIAAPIVIAIAIHESSFNSDLFAHKGGPFGIKAGKPWTGPVFSKWHDGANTQFRVYGSPEEAVLDFGDFIKSRSWYADALACRMDDYRCVMEGLKKTNLEPGYSLNPNWAEDVLGIIQKIELQSLTNR